MKINQVFETPEGKVTFQGELVGKELEAVIAVGLNYLFSVGALPQLDSKQIMSNYNAAIN